MNLRLYNRVSRLEAKAAPLLRAQEVERRQEEALLAAGNRVFASIPRSASASRARPVGP
jgi:hypothetical protein